MTNTATTRRAVIVGIVATLVALVPAIAAPVEELNALIDAHRVALEDWSKLLDKLEKVEEASLPPTDVAVISSSASTRAKRSKPW
jgi:hypothetical protein